MRYESGTKYIFLILQMLVSKRSVKAVLQTHTFILYSVI